MVKIINSRNKESEISDHVFAARLRKNGWTGNYQHGGSRTFYYKKDSLKVIAEVETDNRSLETKAQFFV